MQIAVFIACNLLGLIFPIFGLNGFLHFSPLPLPANPMAGQFLGAPFVSQCLVTSLLLQMVPGALPLAITLFGPVLVNLALFHAFMAPVGLPLPLVLTVLWIIVTLGHRTAIAGLFQAWETPSADPVSPTLRSV